MRESPPWRILLRHLLREHIEEVMLEAGENLKRLIKPELGILPSFLENRLFEIDLRPRTDFFNSPQGCTAKKIDRVFS
jgi:hypothetical protein